MKKPGIPENELDRVNALNDLAILDTPSEKEYDEITKLATFICRVPVAFISLIDHNRQWFKSKVGIDICESERSLSFCAHAITQPNEITEVPDARNDKRFASNPFVTAAENPIIFYCGIPLVDKQKNALGTLCVIDHKPNKLSDKQKECLQSLANQVVNLFELRNQNNYLTAMETELLERNQLLKDFAGVVSHDMKMPLANMIVTADILKARYSKQLDKEATKYLDYLKQSSLTLSNYISSILDHYDSDTVSAKDNRESFDVHHLLEEIVDLFNIQDDCEINFPEKNAQLHCNRMALEQILLNLIGNSLKYNDKNKIIIDIDCSEDTSFYYFKISDNGIGIPKEKQEDIFTLFSTAAQTDRHGNKGNGIGLSTVKKLVINMGGMIKVSSEIGKGTTFNFTVKKTNQQSTTSNR